MNTANSRRAISATHVLTRVSVELAAANEDVALLERLKSAPDRAKRLASEHAKALAERKAAIAADDKARTEARFAPFQSIHVADLKPEMSLIAAPFRIKYTRGTYDIYAKSNVPTEHTAESFGQLNKDAFDYLLERHPDRIPARIMALAPGDPHAAFEEYFIGIRRGYMTR